jgi:hypothetical protein
MRKKYFPDQKRKGKTNKFVVSYRLIYQEDQFFLFLIIFYHLFHGFIHCFRKNVKIRSNNKPFLSKKDQIY